MWPWGKKPDKEGFPKGFRIQRIVSAGAIAISERPAREVAMYFRAQPGIAKLLLQECGDGRGTPTTIIAKTATGFKVGWFTRAAKWECVIEFSDLADAATDYLLFSLGKGRWKPPSGENSG